MNADKKFLTTFDKEQIKWGGCYPQEGSCSPYVKGANLPNGLWVGDKVIFHGEIFFLNRYDLSYRHCTNISPFSCKIRYTGQCKVEEKKLWDKLKINFHGENLINFSHHDHPTTIPIRD